MSIQTEPAASLELTPTMTTLFRYSALTFNSHLIHLDPNYTRTIEHFPDCLVQGPMSCSLLLLLASQSFPDKVLTKFDYRALSPLFVNQSIRLNAAKRKDSLLLWAENALDKRLGMRGTLEFTDK